VQNDAWFRRWLSSSAGSLGLVLLFAVIFFGLQRFTFLLRFPPYERTTLWAPGALTFTALMLSPYRQWWRYYLGLCLGAYSAYYGDRQIPESTALFTAQFHFATVAGGVWGIRRMTQQAPFTSIGAMIVFVITAGLIVPLATTLPKDVVTWLTGGNILWPATIRTFLCVALGMVIATPAFATTLLQFPEWLRRSRWTEKVEALILATVLLSVGALVFTSIVDTDAIPTLVYVPIPILLWATIRFELAGASWALLAIAYLSTANAVRGIGPFVQGAPDDHVLHLQLFLLSLSLPLLFMAIMVQEQRKSHALLIHESEKKRKLEDRFRLVVESTPNAMLIVESAGTIVLVNQQTERWFGRTREQCVGMNFKKLLPQRFQESFSEELRSCLGGVLTDEAKTKECYGLRHGGEEFPIELSLISLDSDHDRLVLISILDLTERRKAEETRRELIHANRLATLSELTASIAHEINQPLAAILSNAEAGELLLEDSTPPLEDLKTILADIRNDDLRASEVIRKLRKLMSRGEVEKSCVEVQSVLQDVIAFVRTETRRRGIEVILTVPAESLYVCGDRTHLQQVLLNLIANSVEAMSGSVEVRRLQITVKSSHPMVVVTVADTGPGIPAEQLNRIFDRFYSTKKEGMGIGLAISKSLIEEHGGKIWVESIEGQGTLFGFQIPESGHDEAMPSLETTPCFQQLQSVFSSSTVSPAATQYPAATQ